MNTKTDAAKAMDWWNGLTSLKKAVLYMDYFGCKDIDKYPDEIIFIWKKETQN